MLRLLAVTVIKKVSYTVMTENMYRLYYCVVFSLSFFKWETISLFYIEGEMNPVPRC